MLFQPLDGLDDLVDDEVGVFDGVPSDVSP